MRRAEIVRLARPTHQRARHHMRALTKTQRDNLLKRYRALEDWNLLLRAEIDALENTSRPYWTDSVNIDRKREKINRNRVEMATIALELGGEAPPRRKTRPACGETAAERRERETEERAAERALRTYNAHMEKLRDALRPLGFPDLPSPPIDWWLKKGIAATDVQRRDTQGRRGRDGHREFEVDFVVAEHTADPRQHWQETETYNAVVRAWHSHERALLSAHESGRRPLTSLELEAICEMRPSLLSCPVNPVTGDDGPWADFRTTRRVNRPTDLLPDELPVDFGDPPHDDDDDDDGNRVGWYLVKRLTYQ